jgi:hypothetical protein
MEGRTAAPAAKHKNARRASVIALLLCSRRSQKHELPGYR